MRRSYPASPLTLVLLLVMLTGSRHAVLAKHPTPNIDSIKAHVTADYGKLPLSFEANRGQADPGVKFLARGPASSLLLTDSGAVFAFAGREPSPAEPGVGPSTVSRRRSGTRSPATTTSWHATIRPTSAASSAPTGARTSAPFPTPPSPTRRA
jgi:hypothetical protein